MMPGLYWHRITEAAGRHFFENAWKVAPEADRIGYRFRGGRPLEFVPREPPFGAGSDPSNIVDARYPYGSIQIPGGTEPIVLHRDAVSGGGYFMVGTVISADLDLIGLLQPHAGARFASVTMEQALAARHDRQRLLNEIRDTLQQNGPSMKAVKPSKIDPITLSVVRGVLETTQREMTLSLENTARSSVFNLAHDYPRPCSMPSPR
jgi:allophanate hydrolase subunit 2